MTLQNPVAIHQNHPTRGQAAIPAADICAVIVTYAPEPALLAQVVASVQTQVGHVVVFDNGSPGIDVATALAGVEAVTVVASACNVGLAAALNRGIERARALGVGHVLLMDQDSVLHAGMVEILAQALAALSAHAPVAAVGPQFVDARSGKSAPFVRMGFPFNDKDYGGPGQTVSCDFLITSGSLMPLAALDRVGGMDESLFIDNVDMDWCFRAKAAGMELHGVCDAQMRHRLGEHLRASRFKPHGVVVHKPFRLYYIMRNRVRLYARASTPRVWVAQDVPRLVLKFLGNSLFIAPRWIRLRFMCRGLWDALRGRGGPMPAP
ncbi:glycosyltransferase family 2 protein [Stenotrophomonas rhizophila]|uniref:glycosyltransferase family 2 protein n=1 Tax=Stenotrophomonas rhizophila TaxID=216778 RepID=UPI0010C005B6|nr:glycosyltransferase family 2 protein [Stenotrophomonas rhizophila]TKK03821.1 glycosyltransferase family 2 protein [Stenotrophomonas rhizophila]